MFAAPIVPSAASFTTKRANGDPALVLGVLDLLARHQPYRDYPFALMLARVRRQMDQRSAVIVLRDAIPIAYFGGVLLARDAAERWHHSCGEIGFDADWAHGDAVVISIVVSDHPRLLRPMARAFAKLYPGHQGYWKRVYTDGRPDSWRPPQLGRR